jgi:YesN/AraC family two-component response regulator
MKNYTVLFVDDEPFILSALTRLFHKDHMTILTASSGNEAMEIVQSREIQVLLTDNLMPGMSGIELARRVKDSSPNTVRVLMSGYSDIDAVLKALNIGEVFRFLLKPWTDMDMKTTVHLALAQYRLMEQNRELLAELETAKQLLQIIQDDYPEIFTKSQTKCSETNCVGASIATGIK